MGVDPILWNRVGSRSYELQNHLDKTTETELIFYPPLILPVKSPVPETTWFLFRPIFGNPSSSTPIDSVSNSFKLSQSWIRNMVQPVPNKMRLEMVIGMQNEILDGGEISANRKFKSNQILNSNLYREIQRNWKLNSNLYREIPKNLRFSILTGWLKSPQSSGFRFVFRWPLWLPPPLPNFIYSRFWYAFSLFLTKFHSIKPFNGNFCSLRLGKRWHFHLRLPAKRILFYFQPNSDRFRTCSGAVHDERAKYTCSCNGLCSKTWDPSHIVVETLWVSTCEKHIRFGNV